MWVKTWAIAGIHMKEYGEDKPVLVIGGIAGDFLGEYQAGGLIIVVNTERAACPLGEDYAAGMHGGKIVVFTDCQPAPRAGVQVRAVEARDIKEIEVYMRRFCTFASLDYSSEVNRKAYVLEPMGRNPYKRLYVNN